MATLKDVADRANVSILIVYRALTKSAEVTESDYEAVMSAFQEFNYQFNITIRDVAACAGVSVATASYVVNNSPLIKPSTSQRVREVIRMLDYHPNTTARNLW